MNILFVVTKVGSHGNNVILDIAQVQANLALWSNFISFIASLGKPFDDIGLVSKKSIQTHHSLSAIAHLSQHVAAGVCDGH